MQTDTLDPQFEIETIFLLGVVLAMAVAIAVV